MSKRLQEKIKRYAELKELGLNSVLIDNEINRQIILAMVKAGK
jgi:hypothetical protein